jgi:hypothetical protein
MGTCTLCLGMEYGLWPAAMENMKLLSGTPHLPLKTSVAELPLPFQCTCQMSQRGGGWVLYFLFFQKNFSNSPIFCMRDVCPSLIFSFFLIFFFFFHYFLIFLENCAKSKFDFDFDF